MPTHDDVTDISHSQRLRLETLIRLRWLAVAGQSITVIVVAFWLGFPLPLVACCVLIALLAAVNFYLAVRYSPAHRLTPSAALALLAFDLAQLMALLFITGGLANPFAPLVCVPVIISSSARIAGSDSTSDSVSSWLRGEMKLSM